MSRLAALILMVIVLSSCDLKVSETSPVVTEESFSSRAFKSGVTVFHDEKRAVTCWVYSDYRKGGISCIPDSQLQGGGQ